MTPEQFVYWLQGFAEMTEATPNDAQWKMIQEHLATVFHKVTNPLEPWKPPGLDELLTPRRPNSGGPWPRWPVGPGYDKPEIIC